jgi:hypothetical protein
LASVTVGKQTKVTNLYETGRQNVEKEAPDELAAIESHRAAPVVVARVAPAKAHLSVFEADEPSVRDGDPMSVAGQILQYVLGAAEGRLRVDHPLLSLQAPKERVEGAWCRECSQLAGKA